MEALFRRVHDQSCIEATNGRSPTDPSDIAARNALPDDEQNQSPPMTLGDIVAVRSATWDEYRCPRRDSGVVQQETSRAGEGVAEWRIEEHDEDHGKGRGQIVTLVWVRSRPHPNEPRRW